MNDPCFDCTATASLIVLIATFVLISTKTNFPGNLTSYTPSGEQYMPLFFISKPYVLVSCTSTSATCLYKKAGIPANVLLSLTCPANRERLNPVSSDPVFFLV